MCNDRSSTRTCSWYVNNRNAIREQLLEREPSEEKTKRRIANCSVFCMFCLRMYEEEEVVFLWNYETLKLVRSTSMQRREDVYVGFSRQTISRCSCSATNIYIAALLLILYDKSRAIPATRRNMLYPCRVSCIINKAFDAKQDNIQSQCSSKNIAIRVNILVGTGGAIRSWYIIMRKKTTTKR
jgi:hypothetical protein